MCYVVEENYKQAADYMKMILSQLENESGTYQVDKQDIAFYKAVYYYLSGLDAGLEKEEIQYYISSFFYEELSTKVCRLFVNTEKIIACQYPEKKASDTEYDTEKLLGEIRDKLKKAQLSSKINQLDIQKSWRRKNSGAFNYHRVSVQSFGEKQVLNSISLKVKKGEIFGLLGPSAPVKRHF